jgi:hypothetical protein
VSRPSQPDRDRLLAREIYGEARHDAPWRELTADEHAAAEAAGRQSNRAEPARAGQS